MDGVHGGIRDGMAIAETQPRFGHVKERYTAGLSAKDAKNNTVGTAPTHMEFFAHSFA